MFQADLVVIGDHDERAAGDSGQVVVREGGLVSVHRGQLGDDHFVVAGSVRRDLAVALPEEVRGLAVEDPGLPAIAVEYSGGEDETAHQVGAAKRDGQRQDGAVAAAEQVHGPADDRVDEGDRVVGHELKGDGPGYVGRVPMAPLFGCVDAEVRCERFGVGGQCAGIDPGPARVQRDQRIALAALVVPHLHMC